MLYRTRAEPNSGQYVEQVALEFSHVDHSALSRAINELIAKHAALRSFFVWREQDAPRLLTVREATITLETSEAVCDRGFLQADRERGIELDRAPMLRVALLNTGETQTCLWTFHHAALDGWSIRILLDEFLRIYQGHLVGSSLPSSTAAVETPPTTDSPGDAWLETLRQAPTRGSLSSLPQAAASCAGYQDLSSWLGPDVATAVQDWCRREHVTYASFMHSAWAILCCHLNGHSDTVFGSIDSGRSGLKDPANAVGMFMQLRPVRVIVEESAGLGDFVRALQARHWRLGESPPPAPAAIAKLLGRTGGEALFDSVLVVQNLPEQPRGPEISLLNVSGYEQADAPLVVSIGTDEKGSMLFRHQTHVFSEETVGSLATIFNSLIRMMTRQDSSKPISSVLDRLASDTAGTLTGEQPDRTVTDCVSRFVQVVDSQAEAIALLDDGEVSYAELSYRAERYKQMLVDLGVTQGSVVGVHLQRSVEAFAAILGVLATGASYLPLDTRYPRERLDFMVRDSGAEAVFTDAGTEFATRNLVPPRGTAGRRLSPVWQSAPTNMCLIYTSGSTGLPKGVFLEHAAIANRVAWMERQFPFTSSDRCCQRTPLSFVDSIYELFGPLSAGITSTIINDASLRHLPTLLDELKTRHVTRLTLVPSLLETLLDDATNGALELPDLRLCVVSGEPATEHLAAKFRDALPNAKLINIYGSTEVTADALYHVVKGPGQDPLVPIGIPITGFSACIRNAVGRQLPACVTGELVIKGIGVANGYHNRSDLSSEKFAEDGFRTGDLAFIDRQHIVHYRGRMDRQLKIRGQRVEPAEVEAVILQQPDIPRAVVFKHDEVLIAACQTEKLNEGQLRESLQNALPPFAVPQRFLATATLPSLPNGKIDLDALHRQANKQPASTATASVLSLHPRQAGLTILNVWRDLLPAVDIELDSNFFTAGGDSLLAMRMLARVERIYGVSIPLPVFIKNPVLGDFAAALLADLSLSPPSELITLRPPSGAADAPAVFCIHGDAFNLVPFLDKAVAVHWISQWTTRIELTKRARALPAQSIESLASKYSKYIRQTGNQAPVLVGSCAAAVVTLEIARLMSRAGQEPKLLILMDLPGAQLRGSLAGRLQTRISGSLIKSAIGWGKRRLGGRQIGEQRERTRILAKIQAMAPLTDIEARAYTQHVLNDALSSYHPRPYPGPVTLVFSQRWRRGGHDEGSVRLPAPWDEVFSGSRRFRFSPAFHHNDLLAGAGADFVADLLKQQFT